MESKIKIKKDLVGIAAEFAVASELGRRNVYAQPTFGHLKRMDLMVIGENGKSLRVEVKGKQGDTWPNCKGISNDQSILVLVDFEEKDNAQRPDFYILTFSDWKALVDWGVADLKKRFPDKGQDVYIDEDCVPVWPSQKGPSGQPYRGFGILPKYVKDSQEKWEKITEIL